MAEIAGQSGRSVGVVRRWLTTAGVLSVLTVSCYGDEPVSALTPVNRVVVGPHDWLIKHESITRLLAATNQHRARVGLWPVQLDTQMCLDAQRHANWMASTGSFQHSGLPYMEIIHQSLPTPEGAVQGWIASPPHHGILVSGATRVGFGFQLRGGYPYWVGVFR